MRFGPVPLDEARGAILAHTFRSSTRVVRKGSVLDEDAISVLRDGGRTDVIAARLDPGDVPEDICADRLANALLSDGIARGRAATGRVNLRAETAGLLVVDTDTINRVNGVDEAFTIGTLENHSVVAARDALATIKIIPFAAPGDRLALAETIARDGPPALTLHPFRPLVVGLVMSELPGLRPELLTGAEAATRDRVEAFGGRLLPPIVCPHDMRSIAGALARLLEGGADLLLIVGASAVVDRRDVGPAAIVKAGGRIEHFGMPVDPGNLICLGRVGETPALVLPGCARSPKPNGIDLVLARMFAGVPVGPGDIARMGVGGLLKDTEIRPMPRDMPDADEDAPVLRPSVSRSSVAAIVLAAGRSTRMGPRNKLLIEDASGRAMIARTVDNVLASQANPVIVITGHMASEIEAALSGCPVRFVHAPDYADGLSASLRAGIDAVPDECAAALVCLGDMPLVNGATIDRIIAAHDVSTGRLIVVPTSESQPGNPVLWDREFFAEIARLTGDSGARRLLDRHRDLVAEVEMSEDGVLRDFDTPDSVAPSR